MYVWPETPVFAQGSCTRSPCPPDGCFEEKKKQQSIHHMILSYMKQHGCHM